MLLIMGCDAMWCNVFKVGRATQWVFVDGLGVNPKADPGTVGLAIFVLRQVARPSVYQGAPKILLTENLKDIAPTTDITCTSVLSVHDGL